MNTECGGLGLNSTTRPISPQAQSGMTQLLSTTRLWLNDGVLVEPLIGIRPWISLNTYEHSIRALLGPEGVNEAKKAEEGKGESKTGPRHRAS